MKKFSLIALRILPECSKDIRKVLKEGKLYFFNNKYVEIDGRLEISKLYSVPDNFYSEKININAIVGKNGSGKSSVIEVLLRLVNNLAEQLFQKDAKVNTYDYTALEAISDLNAELYFETIEYVEDKILKKVHILKCNKNRVYLNQGIEFIHKGFFLDLDAERNDNSLGETSIAASLDILRQFFFTIVSNYSFHAYNAKDYISETEGKDENGNEKIWIDRVFHKNDGYLTPIVLNPFRRNGTIDVEREKDLTNFRLAFLFYYFKLEGKQFMDNYNFSHLSFSLNKKHVIDKYTVNKKESIKTKNEIVKVRFSDSTKDVFNETLRCYFRNTLNDERLYSAYEYLVYKTFSISEKYPNYSESIDKDISEFNDEVLDDNTKDEIKLLVDKILSDNSHTTLKIKQTLNYIKYITNLSGHFNPNGVDYLDENYIKLIALNLSDYTLSNDLDRILVSFPPPFFKIDIHLNTLTDEPITVNKMSSGERQFLFYMSTLMYHLKNLDSVLNGDKSVHYEIVNIILEEVELYFHPEYQCQFVQKLINYLEFGKFNKIDYFNIIIATHSPFILSDIPNENIMFLKKGKQKFEQMPTFGANVHDILRHSFFLENGSMGEFAKDIINDTINYLNFKKLEAKLNQTSSIKDKNEYIVIKDEFDILKSKVINHDSNYHFKIIEMIDEPILKAKLLEMFKDVCSKEEHLKLIKQQIKQLQELEQNLIS